MSARELPGTDAVRVERAKQLLARLQDIDWATTTEGHLAELLGRCNAVIASLIETLEGGERP
ncbi:hypothetical protein AB0E27_00420 [Streptomyces sparsogenes]|uniref:hypothetical protein n=1 Tax=Streptomyces sparsogenes TaxID=67365 RepID=UPI0033DFD34B